MKLEVGMYVRTKDGYISQYKYYDTTNAYMGKILCMPLNNGTFANIEDIVKTSYNIVDILEKGDYVNGLRVNEISEYTIFLDDMRDFSKKDINYVETIVTKEQFESMSYKVGEE